MTAVDVRQVLTDPGQGGAYFVDAQDAQALAEAADGLEFAVARIELDGCADKAAALGAIARGLRFPGWFGANFDALADSLGDMSWLPADGYLLLLEHADAWREADDDNFATLLDVLNEAAASWGDQGKPFWAVFPLQAEHVSQLAF
ncbi:barstar family protein [Agrilutibacter solisilvae]|uniref:Barstar family protein n=1 Tax=Agrilutibacter solisilvae TaxID=2763317 RepID=A0A974Y0Q3_9GAMM|nr:barstar family protein [Lysobacter solisilvae]QSX79123.1 barstar family protein [Lysobacter solisilvae]